MTRPHYFIDTNQLDKCLDQVARKDIQVQQQHTQSSTTSAV